MDWATQCAGCGKCCGPAPIPRDVYYAHESLIVGNIIDLDETSFPGIVIPTTATFQCVFYDLELGCKIYEFRPEVCRLYGTVPELKCPFV